MNYISTRGAGIGERHTFSDILLGGLAKDGGLYLPNEYPRVSADELARWRTLPYADLAFEILRHAPVETIAYEGTEEPYADLVSKRTDAVLLDDIIAARYGMPKPELRVVGDVRIVA